MEGGYIEEAKEFLERNKVKVWANVDLITVEGTKISGLILPAPENTRKYIYIKLPNGYNIAIEVKRISQIRVNKIEKIEYRIPEKPKKKKPNLPNVMLLGAGGTIASRVEYSTGAVKPAFTETELLNAIPELENIANIDAINLFNIFSEDMKPRNWIEIAKKIENSIQNDDYRGIVITHGTDTMQYTAAALAFMLDNIPIPITITGAQRSSDRPASDSATNLIASVLFTSKSDVGEVTVVMHKNLNDTICTAHRGVRVRKMHSSRRDAFKTIGDTPIADIDLEKGKIVYLRDDYTKVSKDKTKFKANPVFEEKTAMLYIYPNIPTELIEYFIDKKYRGIVLIGTGLGHVAEDLLKPIERGVQEKVTFVMTTQCLWGPVAMNVYERGRRLQKIGVIPANGILPEVAYVKLGWILAQTEDQKEIRKLMTTNLKNEIVLREKISQYIC